jgi:hypothetical protein
VLTRRHPSQSLAPQARSACSAASPIALCPHALPIALLALLDPLLRLPISLSAAHRGLECVAAVHIVDTRTGVVATSVSKATWLSIERHRTWTPSQIVRSAKTGWKLPRLVGLPVDPETTPTTPPHTSPAPPLCFVCICKTSMYLASVNVVSVHSAHPEALPRLGPLMSSSLLSEPSS